MLKKMCLIVCSLIGVSSGVAMAQQVVPGSSGVYVEVYVNGQWQNANSQFPNRYRMVNGQNSPEPGLTGSQLDDIEVSTFFDGANEFYAVFAASGSSVTDIGNITITGSGNVILGRTIFGNPTVSVSIEPPIAGFRDIQSLTVVTGGNPVVSAHISGDVNGDFAAYQIANLVCDDIRGSVVSNPKDMNGAPNAGWIECNTIVNGGSVVAIDVTLSSLLVLGNVSGEVRTTGSGSISSCIISGSLNGGTIDSDLDIINLEIFGNAYGTIKAGRTIDSIQVEGTWGGGGTLDTTGVRQINTIVALNEFVGDLYYQAGPTDPVESMKLDRIQIEGYIHSKDSGQLVPSMIWSSTDMRNFTMRGLNAPVSSQHAKLDFTVPSVGAFFFNPQYEEGLVNIVNGIPKYFDAGGGVIESGRFRFAHGIDAGTQVHFGYDPNDPLRIGNASTSSFLNFNNFTVPWDGEVTVGLSPTDSNRVILTDDYTALSSEIGGGSFGIVPFNFHQRTTAPASGLAADQDCRPYQLETVLVTPINELKEVVISHYGPVFYDSAGGGAPFRVEFKPAFSPSTWIDRTDLFEIVTDNDFTNPDPDVDVYTRVSRSAPYRNTVVIRGNDDKNNHGFEAAGTWRIHLEDGYIKCANTLGDPNVVWDSTIEAENCSDSDGTIYNWYQFHVWLQAGSGSLLLQGGNGPESSDLAEWIQTPYETNGDGDTDVQDFVDMSNQYSAE